MNIDDSPRGHKLKSETHQYNDSVDTDKIDDALL